jgi:hypothetical protein
VGQSHTFENLTQRGEDPCAREAERILGAGCPRLTILAKCSTPRWRDQQSESRDLKVAPLLLKSLRDLKVL